YAFRSLRRAPGFAIIAIITLGLGIAVNTTVFSVINGILLRPLPVPHAGQITVLGLQQNGDSTFQPFSYLDYQDIARDTTGAFSDVFGYNVTLSALNADNRGDHCIFSRVTGNYFSALGVKPAVGRLILPSEGQTPGADPVVVLGYNFWMKRFGGDPSVVGKHVLVDGHAATIVGVTEKSFHGVYAIMDMDGYYPLSAPFGDGDDPVKTVRDVYTQREDRRLSLLARLKPGVSVAQAGASLNVVAQRLAQDFPAVDKGIAIRAFPEKLARPEPDPENTLPRAAIAFSALAALVLLVACFNIANVLLVRATAREREMGVRAALGAGRGRLIRQHLTESLLLSFLGAIAGVVLATWCAGFLSTLSLGTDLPIRFDFYPDTRVYLFALAAVLVTAVVVGLVPALRVARADVNSLLREGGRSSSDGRKRHIVRNTLVGAQVAGSMLLLIVAGLFTRSLSKAEQITMGFNPDHVLNLSVDVNQLNYSEAQGRAFFKQVNERIAATPGVLSVAQAFTVPLGVVSADAPITLPGQEIPAGQQPPHIMRNLVTAKYLETLQIPLVSGRSFTDSDDQKAPRVAVINESMAKQFWPNTSALGQKFNDGEAGRPDVEVVGIVRDSIYKDVSSDHKAPFFYMPFDQEYLPMRTIQVRTSVPPESLATQLEAEIRDLAPGLAVTQVQTMSQSLQGVNGFFFFRFGAQLTGAMGMLGLILAVVGVFSMVSYSAAQRTHEIGIRMALGAEPRDILKMVMRQSALVVGIGLLAGLAIAFVGTSAIANFIVGIKPTDPATFITVAVALTLVALVACWIPARRATRVSPLVALRHE
ncbi:MAG: ABC transporter permease, partial [Candidatus Acidiferrales bacterium]